MNLCNGNTIDTAEKKTCRDVEWLQCLSLQHKASARFGAYSTQRPSVNGYFRLYPGSILMHCFQYLLIPSTAIIQNVLLPSGWNGVWQMFFLRAFIKQAGKVVNNEVLSQQLQLKYLQTAANCKVGAWKQDLVLKVIEAIKIIYLIGAITINPYILAILHICKIQRFWRKKNTS